MLLKLVLIKKVKPLRSPNINAVSSLATLAGHLYQQLDVEQRVSDGRHPGSQHKHSRVHIHRGRRGFLLHTGCWTGPVFCRLHLQSPQRRSTVHHGQCQTNRTATCYKHDFLLHFQNKAQYVTEGCVVFRRAVDYLQELYRYNDPR